MQKYIKIDNTIKNNAPIKVALALTDKSTGTIMK